MVCAADGGLWCWSCVTSEVSLIRGTVLISGTDSVVSTVSREFARGNVMVGDPARAMGESVTVMVTSEEGKCEVVAVWSDVTAIVVGVSLLVAVGLTPNDVVPSHSESGSNDVVTVIVECITVVTSVTFDSLEVMWDTSST